MEVYAPRTGFALHKKPNQGNIGRSMNTGDLVRLTPDGVVAAWHPDVDADVVGIVVKLAETEWLASEDGTTLVTVEWPLRRDTHLPQDLDIVRKHFS
jgi:hypothetical protein